MYVGLLGYRPISEISQAGSLTSTLKVRHTTLRVINNALPTLLEDCTVTRYSLISSGTHCGENSVPHSDSTTPCYFITTLATCLLIEITR